jgi:hypothetical protein
MTHPNDMDKLKETIETLKQTTGTPKWTGWMYDEQGLLIYSLIKYVKPEIVIQTGHLWGKSACFILEALNDGLLNTRTLEESQESDKNYTDFVDNHKPSVQREAKLISIDPFRSPERHTPPRWQKGIEYLKEKYGDGFEFYRETSDQFFANNREKYIGKHTLAVVDGDHSPEGLRRDLENLNMMQCKYIIVDDVLFLPHLGKVCEGFASEKGFEYAPINLFNGFGLLTKK